MTKGVFQHHSPDLGDGYGGRFMEPKLKELLKRQNLKASGGRVSSSPPKDDNVRQPSWVFNNSKAECSESSQDSEDLTGLIVDEQLKKKLRQQYKRAAKGIILVSSLPTYTMALEKQPSSPRQPTVNSIRERRELFTSNGLQSVKPSYTKPLKDATSIQTIDRLVEDGDGSRNEKTDVDYHISLLKQIEMEHAKVLAEMELIETCSDSNDNEAKSQSHSSVFSLYQGLRSDERNFFVFAEDSDGNSAKLEKSDQDRGKGALEEQEMSMKSPAAQESATTPEDVLSDLTACLTPIVVDNSQAIVIVTKGQQEELFSSYDNINASYMYWTDKENLRCTLQYPSQKQDVIECELDNSSLGHISCDIVEIIHQPTCLMQTNQRNHIPADVHVSFSSQESTNTILSQGRLVRAHAQGLVEELKQNLSKMKAKPLSLKKAEDLPPHEPPFPPETYGLQPVKQNKVPAVSRRSILRDLDRDWLQNLQNRQNPRRKQEDAEAIQRQWRHTSLMIRGSDSCRSIPALPLLEDSRLGTDGQWILPFSRGAAGRQQAGSSCFRC